MLHHSTLGLRVKQKKKRSLGWECWVWVYVDADSGWRWQRTTIYRGTSLIRIPFPPQVHTVARCLGTYGGHRGVGMFYERGTPVVLDDITLPLKHTPEKHLRAYISLQRTRLCEVTPVIQHGVVSPEKPSPRAVLYAVERARTSINPQPLPSQSAGLPRS